MLVALAALTIAVHGRHVRHDWVNWDDGQMVTKNAVLNPVSPSHLGRIWSQPTLGLYTPLAYTVWAGTAAAARLETPDAQQRTLNPHVFHCLNVFLHLASVLAAFAVIYQLIDDPIAAGAGAALFAVHPLQVEPIGWISGMNNLLAGALALGCITAYVRFAKLPTPRRWWWYGLSIALLVLALLSKPTAVVTPLMLIVIDLLLLRRAWKTAALSIAPLLLAAMGMAVVATIVQPATTIVAPAIHYRLLIVADSVGFYLLKLIWPWPLYFDYSRTPEWVITRSGSVATLLATTAAVGTAIFTFRRWPTVTAAMLLFVAGLVLVLGFVPFEFQVYSTVADRYAYLAMLGPSVLLATWLARRPRVMDRSAAVAILAVLSVISFRQGAVWASTSTLLANQLKHHPDTLAVHTILAGEAAEAGDFIAVERHYRAGLVLRPNDVEFTLKLANLLAEDRPAESLPYYQKAYESGARYPMMFNNWGRALFKLKLVPAAVEAFKASLAGDPFSASAHTNLGYALAHLSQFEQAEYHLRQALAIDPANREAAEGLRLVQAAQQRRIR